MFIKKINPFIYTDKIEGYYHLVDLVKAHYEKELKETDKIYSKIETDDCEHLGRFIDELYFSFKDDIDYQCNEYNIIFEKNEEILSNYFKELDTFKEKTNALFDKYYPIEDY
jgi:hypothetical protein